MLETYEFDENDMNDEDYLDEEKANSRIRSIIRGVVKIELLERLETQKELFPLTNKKSLYYINFYIVKKRFSYAPDEIKRSILDGARSIHKKEMHRIRKTFATLRSNIITETVDMQIGEELYEKIYRYLVYQWLKEEFYIKKTLIRRYIHGLIVFFPEMKPQLANKLKTPEPSNAKVKKIREKRTSIPSSSIGIKTVSDAIGKEIIGLKEDKDFGGNKPYIDLTPIDEFGVIRNIIQHTGKEKWSDIKKHIKNRVSRACEFCGASEFTNGIFGQKAHKFKIEFRYSIDNNSKIATLHRLMHICVSCSQSIHLGKTQLQGEGQYIRAVERLCKFHNLQPHQIEQQLLEEQNKVEAYSEEEMLDNLDVSVIKDGVSRLWNKSGL